jgi:hypothetical protein
MQTRAITGVEFEKELETEFWVRKESKPKLIWEVDGKNNFDKIKNVNYDVTKFNLSDKSVINKWDFVSTIDDRVTFEVKRYKLSKFNKWVMYSEPFFKVADRQTAKVVDRDKYNRFVYDFFEKRKDIINKVLNEIGNGNSGIRCLDGFIPQDKLEYRAEILKGWDGFKRITVMCKLKDKYIV